MRLLVAMLLAGLQADALLVPIAGSYSPSVAVKAGTKRVPARDTRFELASSELGETREIWVDVPEACASGPCDTLYVLDAHALYPLATSYLSVMRAMGRMPPVIVVGVPSRSTGDRLRNFTYTVGTDDQARFPNAGGAARFARFLDRELIPDITRRYSAGPRRVLAGHSLAGVFAIESLAHGASFEAYVAISPAVGWHDSHAVSVLEAWLGSDEAARRQLYASIAEGDAEQYHAAFGRLVAALERHGDRLQTRIERFPGEDHVTTVAPSLHRALKWLFGLQP